MAVAYNSQGLTMINNIIKTETQQQILTTFPITGAKKAALNKKKAPKKEGTGIPRNNALILPIDLSRASL